MPLVPCPVPRPAAKSAVGCSGQQAAFPFVAWFKRSAMRQETLAQGIDRQCLGACSFAVSRFERTVRVACGGRRSEDGWAPPFNGKDLTNREVSPENKGGASKPEYSSAASSNSEFGGSK